MELRPIDYNNDVPEIVALLRTSLSNKHTEENFIWKHKNNPFGSSYGLVAWEKDRIVGVRMFMFWEFRKSDEVIKAIRPVDTITHPDYRGKGIFKKLTLLGLEDCKELYDFVFNTPNTNSLPGYLKMGWNKFDKDLSYKLALNLNFLSSGSIEFLSVKDVDFKNSNYSTSIYRTNFTREYAQWRYQDLIYKVARYKTGNESILIFYKTEKIKGFKTLIVLDITGDPSFHKPAVSALASKLKILFAFYLETPLVNLNFLFSVKRNKSIVVLKEEQSSMSKLLSFSAGDLEGRL
jgi:GNAT superfamily N-acetyltransferase